MIGENTVMNKAKILKVIMKHRELARTLFFFYCDKGIKRWCQNCVQG